MLPWRCCCCFRTCVWVSSISATSYETTEFPWMFQTNQQFLFLYFLTDIATHTAPDFFPDQQGRSIPTLFHVHTFSSCASNVLHRANWVLNIVPCAPKLPWTNKKGTTINTCLEYKISGVEFCWSVHVPINVNISPGLSSYQNIAFFYPRHYTSDLQFGSTIHSRRPIHPQSCGVHENLYNGWVRDIFVVVDHHSQ